MICSGGVFVEDRIAPDFLSDIPKKNTPYYTLVKIFFRYAALFVLAFSSGVLFCLSGFGSLEANEEIHIKISEHFTNVFVGCESIRDYFLVIFASSATDIRYLVLIFAAGFTYFCGIASSAFIVCRGVTLGFSISFLYESVKSQKVSLSYPNAALAIFSVTELAIALFIIFLSTKSLVFSYDFKKLRGRRSLIMRSPTIYKYLIFYLTAFGLMILINIISCFISMLIYR